MRLFITALACLISVSVFGQLFACEFCNIKGDVKSIVGTNNFVIEKFGEIIGDPQRKNDSYEHHFKQDGYLLILKTIEYDSDESIKSRVIYEYDDEGNRVETISYDSEENIKWKSTEEYDDEGNRVETID